MQEDLQTLQFVVWVLKQLHFHSMHLDPWYLVLCAYKVVWDAQQQPLFDLGDHLVYASMKK